MLVSECVVDALEMLSIVNPTQPEMARGVTTFQQLVDGLLGVGVGGQWGDYIATADRTAYEDERTLGATSGINVTIPDRFYIANNAPVSASATDDPTTMRPPLDGARVQVVDEDSGGSVTYLWRADMGQYIAAYGLEQNSQSPFNSNMDEALTAMLAVRLSMRYPGCNVTPMLMAANDRAERLVGQRYARPINVQQDAGLLHPLITGIAQ